LKREERIGLEKRIYDWVVDFIKNEEDANTLTLIIMYHVRKELKLKVLAGFLCGITTLLILIKWLS